jgi:hypothetical protein
MMSDDGEIKVFDNFLPSSYFNQIKQKITEELNFPWYFNGNTTSNDGEDSNLSQLGFSHSILTNDQISNHELYLMLCGFYGLLLDFTKTKNLVKSRIDMTVYSPSKVRHPPHIDLPFPHITSIFYITDSDAETVVYDYKVDNFNDYTPSFYQTLKVLPIKKTIQPKENTIVFFDGSYIHTGYSPSKYKNRILINTNLV